MTAGTVDHCAHGKQNLVFTTLDSRPFHHVTSDMALPMGATLRFSIPYKPFESGTRVTVRYARPVAGNTIAQALVRLISKFQTGPARQGWIQSFANLEALIAEDLAASAIQAEMAAEVPGEQLQSTIRDAIGVATQ